MKKARRQYGIEWWGWKDADLRYTSGKFSGYLQIGPVVLIWFGN